MPLARDALTGTVTWNGEVSLEGVAFYQKFTGPAEGVIRCHGRESIYSRVPARQASGSPPVA